MASGLPADCDRAWDGLIYYKKGTFVSRYEPYWGVVRRESSRGLQRIDLFRPLSAVHSTSDLFIPLHDVLHVLDREARAKRFAFQILATGCKYHLATDTAEDREIWVQGLKQFLFGPPRRGVVYEYQVIVIPNSHSEKLQLSGRYILRITDSHIALFTSTGTLPTRFLYSLSDVARTRYNTFTDAGQKFSVLVLYCHGDVSADYTPVQKSTKSASCAFGNGGVVGDEEMFVFQTQSASTICRAIEHRAKEISKRGQQKSTSPSSHLPNYPAMSLPTSSCFPICEKEPLAPSVVQPSSKPRPPPRPARTSTQDTSSPAHPDLNLNHSTSESSLPLKTIKAPIPLPRHKKHSFDSNQLHTVRTTDKPHPPPPLTKPKPHRRPKPTLGGQSSHGSLQSCISITSTSSLPSPHNTEPPVTEDFKADAVDSQAVEKCSTENEPMYVNLTSSPTSNGQEEGQKDMEEDQCGEVIVGAENRDSALPASYILSPSKSYDEYLAAGGNHEAAPQYSTVPPSKSCDILTSPSHTEDGVKQSEAELQRPIELPLGDQVVPSPPDSPEREGSPTLDDFLAKILKRRRESQDINQECDNESNAHQHGRFSLSRTRSSNPRIMMQAGAHVSSPQTPYYYNMPPLMRTKGLTVDEDEDEEGDSAEMNGSDERNCSDEKKERKVCCGESLTEKEYRSEWLRKGSSVQDWMPMTTKDGNEYSEDEDLYCTYLKILPSTAQSLPHPPPHTENRHMFPALEEQHSNSTPESGSPLWDTHRASSRQSIVPSPLTQGGAENSPPSSPQVQDPPAFPGGKGIKRSSPVFKKKRMCSSRRRSGRRGTLSGGGIKLPVADQTDLDGSVHKRRSSRRKSGTGTFRPGPLPSLPGTSVEVDSDYEWAEVDEVLSDTGSDYIYTTPFDLGLEYHPRRSASCSELAPFLTGPASIGQRPPAPLPLASQDPVTQENPSHVESPDSSPMKTAEEKRSIFQHSHSVGDGFSTEMCELLSLLWYHSITLHALLVCV
ncbi:hypothetical protein GBAR_LOCUS12861 [Geodia barretti]|uniref:PH domain-containing protein n=1 Tax=Geodia barretti TaxID=519541 RepID=A0AA35S1Y4_GEOBA|nr:hypothetical protein GBAR_LOCUS12861 [Geodia barretti]